MKYCAKIFSLSILLSGCITTPQPLPKLVYIEKKPDTNGYYNFASYKFKGKLKDGTPDGKGQCITDYLTGINNISALKGACEFSMGVRIDDLHSSRLKKSMENYQVYRANQLKGIAAEAAEDEGYAAQERREQARRRESFEQNLGASLANLNQQMARDHQKMSAAVQKASTPQVPTYSTHTSVTNNSNSGKTAPSGEAKVNGGASKGQEGSNLSKSASIAKTKVDQVKPDHQRDLQVKQAVIKEQQLQEKKRKAEELAAQKKQVEKERLEKKQNEEKAKLEFLAKLRGEIQLMARTCYGANYVVGKRPKTSSTDPVSGINVHYRVTCGSNGSIGHNGISRNFIGIGTDCFTGDTPGNEIPKGALSCKAEEMVVEVTQVTSTR